MYLVCTLHGSLHGLMEMWPVLVPFFQAFKQGSIVREEWQGTEENIIS